MRPVSGDVQNESALAAVLAGHDVVIHSVKFLSTNVSKIIAATKAAKVPRLLVVGGAGSLTAKAAYPPKTLRSQSWMSWNSRSTLANDSRLGTDN